MSVSRGFGLNGKSIYTNLTKPMEINLNFVVDSANGNGLGIRSLKSNGYVESVYMNVANGGANGRPSLNLAQTYAILGASTVTNTGSSVLTGNLGVSPGSAITGFPPGTVSGTVNAANAAAANAQAQALAAYNALNALSATPISATLDGQTLTPGVYTESSSTFSLAASGNGTLTLNGAGLYVFICASTLVTGSGGTPTITLSGGATAANIFWIVRSSATINSGHAGTFQGNVLANTSITDTSGGTVNGSLIALNGAVTLSAASTINVQLPTPATVAAGNPNPAPGYAWIHLKNNFNRYIGGFQGFVSPLSGSNVAVNSTSLTLGQAYVIVSVGTSTLADWQAIGLPAGFTPTVGQSFIAIKSGNGSGSGQVQKPSQSGINAIEVVGDPNQMISNSSIAANAGAWLLVQFLSNSGVTAPLDNSVCGMQILMDGSSVTIDGL